MKKKRLIILLSILVVVAIIGCFTFLYRAAAAEKDSFYKNCVYYEDEDAVNQRLSRLPEQIELGTEPKPGYTNRFQDFSFILPGYNDDIINYLSTDHNLIYIFDDDRTFSFVEWITILYGSNIFRDAPDFLSQMENTTGRNINTFYDLWEASFYCTPDDYTMFDIDKNEVVSTLLEYKHNHIDDICYQFDNGVIKGFICASALKNDPEYYYISVLLSNCNIPDSLDIPDSYYLITCNCFSIEEVKDILSTITFDGSNNN